MSEPVGPTNPVLRELISVLELERVEDDYFRGASQELGWGRIFGGQVVGQALSAAEQTVPTDRPVHSLHGYFLRPGDPAHPILYAVDRIRDGRSFTTRRVVAVQKGVAILNLSASFHKAEPGFDHQDPVPDAPPPEERVSQVELARMFADTIPAHIQRAATMERPIEIRPVAPINPSNPGARPPRRQVWIKAVDRLPDDPRLHRYVLAWASDFNLLATALQPHGATLLSKGIQSASVDHAMWFHRPFRVDEWLLYDVVSPSASGARGLVKGRFFTRDGVLVASTAQEGLIRQRSAR